MTNQNCYNISQIRYIPILLVYVQLLVKNIFLLAASLISDSAYMSQPISLYLKIDLSN